MDESEVRAVVREELAALAGKALRRTQDRNYTRSPDRNMAIDVANDEMAEFWGEVLAEYGGGEPITDEEGKTVGHAFREDWPVPDEPVDVPPGSGSSA